MPYCVPAWGWAEHQAILRCLLTGKLIEGPQISRLCEEIRRKTAMRYVFGFDSGQTAIYAVLKAWGAGPGDRVIMPSYCCETVAKAIVHTGARPLFCDIGEDYNPDTAHILELLNPSVKAVIFPHLFGNPGDIDKLEQDLEERGIRKSILLVDDAAQSFGARLNGRPVGTFGDAGIISFGPGKTMTATGGGLLLTNHSSLAESVRRLNISKENFVEKFKRLIYWIFFRRWRSVTLPFFPYVSRLLRMNGRESFIPKGMCNVDATIGSLQLGKLDKLLAIRVSRKQVLDGLSARQRSPVLVKRTPQQTTEKPRFNAATKYLVRIDTAAPENLQGLFALFMHKEGIEIQSLYFPIHLNPAYSSEKQALYKTEAIYQSVLQIPLEPSIQSADFEHVVQSFVGFTRTLRNHLD